MRGFSADTGVDTDAENGKLHQGPHAGKCPTRNAASPNGQRHTPPNCLNAGGVTIVTADLIQAAPTAPTGPDTSALDAIRATLATLAETVATMTEKPPTVVLQPKAEVKPKAEAKARTLGEAETQPNASWWRPLANGMTAYGFVTTLAKLNKNYGRIEFPNPSSIDDGNQILHNTSPHSCHNATLGEAQVGQHYQNFSWPGLEVNIYDVLSELDGWDRSLLPNNIG